MKHIMNLPNADDMNYWKTSKVDADTWIDKTKLLITGFGGTILGDAYGNDVNIGRSAYMIHFSIGTDTFKLVWPVLPSEELKAARRQAATMLYHDTKAKCLKAAIFGARTAFFEYLILPDGRQASQLSSPEILAHMPELLKIEK